MPKAKNKKNEAEIPEVKTDLTEENTSQTTPDARIQNSLKDKDAAPKEFVVVVKFIDAISGKVYEVDEIYPESSDERLETLLGNNMHHTAFIKPKVE